MILARVCNGGSTNKRYLRLLRSIVVLFGPRGLQETYQAEEAHGAFCESVIWSARAYSRFQLARLNPSSHRWTSTVSGKHWLIITRCWRVGGGSSICIDPAMSLCMSPFAILESSVDLQLLSLEAKTLNVRGLQKEWQHITREL